MMRFAIRDILWLTVVAAIALGWWVQQQSLPRPDPSITGTITVAGLPLDHGRITFVSARGSFRGAAIVAGEFSLGRIPVGTYQVTIQGENVPALYSNMTTTVTERTKSMQYGLHSAEHLATLAAESR
jgi:hypothetical protein